MCGCLEIEYFIAGKLCENNVENLFFFKEVIQKRFMLVFFIRTFFILFCHSVRFFNSSVDVRNHLLTLAEELSAKIFRCNLAELKHV